MDGGQIQGSGYRNSGLARFGGATGGYTPATYTPQTFTPRTFVSGPQMQAPAQGNAGVGNRFGTQPVQSGSSTPGPARGGSAMTDPYALRTSNTDWNSADGSNLTAAERAMSPSGSSNPFVRGLISMAGNYAGNAVVPGSGPAGGILGTIMYDRATAPPSQTPSVAWGASGNPYNSSSQNPSNSSSSGSYGNASTGGGSGSYAGYTTGSNTNYTGGSTDSTDSTDSGTSSPSAAGRMSAQRVNTNSSGGK